MKSYRFVVFTIVLTLVLVSCAALTGGNTSAVEGPDYSSTLSAVSTKSAFETSVAVYTQVMPTSTQPVQMSTQIVQPTTTITPVNTLGSSCIFHIKVVKNGQIWYEAEVKDSYSHPDGLKKDIKAGIVGVYITTTNHGVFFNDAGTNWKDYIQPNQSDVYRLPRNAGESTGFAVWCNEKQQ